MSVLLLVGQCIAMVAASLFVGSLPLMFKSSLSALSLAAIEVFGMGLLVGAALTIIIPEGVETLYAAEPDSHVVGIALLAGFALMLLVENLTPHPPHAPPQLEEAAHPMLPKDEAECETHAAAHGLSATLGLVIHGAADGIALGASSLSDNKGLGMIVFLAIIIHKGPAALGLTTTLLTLHLTPAQCRRRLLFFSLSAPAGALLTYGLVRLFGTGPAVTGRGSLSWWTGVALLFSGGSFLYVATVLQPITQTGPDDHCHDVHHEVHRQDKPILGHLSRTFIILLGMVLPLGMSALVDHHH